MELSEGLSGMSEILLLKEVVIYLESHKKNRSLLCKFVVIFFEGLSWELVYSGPAKEHVCEGLKPGCSYQTRVYCMSEGGQSPVSQCTVFFFLSRTFFNQIWSMHSFMTWLVKKRQCSAFHRGGMWQNAP